MSENSTSKNPSARALTEVEQIVGDVLDIVGPPPGWVPIPGSEFDGYARPTPEGDWSYIIDDTCISYSQQPWPFRRQVWHGFGEKRLNGSFQEGAYVRLSPDTAFYAWRNEYVLLFGPDDKVNAFGSLWLWVGPQGMGGYVYRAHFDIDVATLTCTYRRPIPPELAEAAQMKLDRVTAFLLAERARRDAGEKAPVTAADLEDRRESEKSTS